MAGWSGCDEICDLLSGERSLSQFFPNEAQLLGRSWNLRKTGGMLVRLEDAPITPRQFKCTRGAESKFRILGQWHSSVSVHRIPWGLCLTCKIPGCSCRVGPGSQGLECVAWESAL